jgi:hypothetical protein
MGADMILDHLHQQAVDRATATGDLMHEQSADSNPAARTMNAISMLAELSIRIVSRKSQLGSTWEARAPISVDGGHGVRREPGHGVVRSSQTHFFGRRGAVRSWGLAQAGEWVKVYFLAAR